MNPKQRAAEAALQFVRSDTAIGLGTGSTADFFLAALADALHTGQLRNVLGVATSNQSERRARELGIPLTTLGESPELDLTVDGADEVSPRLDLIKGLGGALLREKIVAQNSRQLVIIADASKVVTMLGTKAALPVEVIEFAHNIQATFLASLGCTATLRKQQDGLVFRTDNGNLIYDCKFDGIADPRSLAAGLGDRAGIVETGLFLGIAKVVLIADETQVRTLRA